MPDANKTLELHLQRFLEEDAKVRGDPLFGMRNAENVLMALCEFFKQNASRLDDIVKTRVVRKLQSMNLSRYRSYCREHLLDIGIKNV